MFLSHYNNENLVIQQSFIIKYYIYTQLLDVIHDTNDNIIPDPKVACCSCSQRHWKASPQSKQNGGL